MADIYTNLTKGLYRIQPINNGVFEISPEQIGDGAMLSVVEQKVGNLQNGKVNFSNDAAGFILGVDKDVAKFYIGDTTNYLNWDGSSLVVAGSLTASAGTIGGFSIGSDYFRDAADSFGLASTVSGSDDVRFWAGDTFANRATADFRVTESGAVTASNITITGGSVVTSVLSGTIAQGNLNVADRGWVQTCVFSVTDADTVAWGSGTFTSADGTAYSITGSNTGNMVAKTYIYLDTAVSTTAYQTTTTATTAVGAGKVLVAIAQNGTGEATFTVLQGQGGQNIDASSIVAGSITANEIAASTITAGKLSVSTLSSITADLGTVTAGSVYSGLFSTSTSGSTTQRILMQNSDNSLRFYDSSNSLIVSIGTNLYSSAIEITRSVSSGSAMYAVVTGGGRVLSAISNSNATSVYISNSNSGTSSTCLEVINNGNGGGLILSNGYDSDTYTNGFGLKIENSNLTRGNMLELVNNYTTSSYFKKEMVLDGVTVWKSDGTHTPNGNLSGTAGDICLNGDSGKIYYCTGTTNWVAGQSSLTKSLTAGENISANDAVIVASGNMVSNTISNTTSNSNYHIYGTNWVGQTFQTSANTVSILGIKVKLGLVGSLNMSSHIFLYATSGGLPTGAALVDLASSPTISSDADEYTFTFSSPVSVSPSTTYALVVDFFHGDSSNYIACYYNSSSVYANGTYISTSDSGANWTADSNKDLYFKVLESYHTPGRIYKADSSDDSELSENFAGFATQSITSGNSGVVAINGIVSGFSSLTKGEQYYLSGTAGAISTTKAYPKCIGLAVSDTELLITADLLEIIKVTASDNLKTSADNVASTTNGTYAKVKEIQIYYPGTYRVTFDLKEGGGGFTAYGKIYVNDAAVGTERTNTSTTYSNFSEDISNLKSGDKIQLYLHGPGGGQTEYCRNFRLFYDKTIASGDNIITN